MTDVVDNAPRGPDSAKAAEEAGAHVDGRTRAVKSEAGSVFHAGPTRCSREGRAERAIALGARRVGARIDAQGPGRSPRGAGAGRDCRSSARSGTGACWCRRSRSSAAPRTSWRPISRTGRGRDCTRSSAAMRTSRTSASSPRRIGRLRLQHQRLRRDAAGAVRVGRQAACGELRGRGSGSRLRRRRPAARS